MVPSYSIAKNRPSGDKYGEANFVDRTLGIFEGVKFSKEPSIKVFSEVDSAPGYVSTYLVNFKSFASFENPR